MNEELVNNLRNDITNLQTAVHILNDNSKHLLVRSEIILSVLSAMVATGLLNRDILAKIINGLSFDSSEYSDLNDVAEIEKSVVIRLLDKVKVSE
ncbi:hypothetical protein [Xenorhabdus szentirmaii]|uniref:hypothetical protein n=1 Tax=Xenorhabdus szentirmaii TaxID=290112 RepID=UPI0019929F6A|nr:hypothetical protein [Xenorhabdus sp. 38]MBD2782765.1 hypothetical protein [Xenorhabdus sp. 38]